MLVLGRDTFEWSNGHKKISITKLLIYQKGNYVHNKPYHAST